MAREMRRKDRQLTEEKAVEMMRDALWGTLSLSTGKGEPYGVPVNFVYVDKTIYIHCAKEGKKIDLIKENKRASFCIVASSEIRPEAFTTAYSSAMAMGNIEIAPETEKGKALELIIEKYCPSLELEGADYIKRLYDRTEVIKLSIESISGKANI